MTVPLNPGGEDLRKTGQTRRQFLITGGYMLAAGSLASLAGKCGSPSGIGKKWSGFRYAMCNESMQALPGEKQCEIVAAAGFEGIEIAPFTLVREGVQEISKETRKNMLSTMKANGLSCAGLHWLLAPPPAGLHFTTPDKNLRLKSIAYLDALIDFCGDLEGKTMIFGSPKQRNTVGISINEAKKYFAEGLAQVAGHAEDRGVTLLIEPLDTSQTDVVNTMAEAKELMEMVNHPAVRMMFDFHNTPNETEPFHVLIEKYFKYIRHVHVQEMDGKHLGKGNAVNDFVHAFQTLKNLGYDNWVSLEVFDFSPGGEAIAKQSIEVLKTIEKKLV